jgi:hypothetical protein
MKREKHIEKQAVDGVEKVKVEVSQPLKRLFRFAGDESLPHNDIPSTV